MSRIEPRKASVTIYQGDDLEHLTVLKMAAENERRREDVAKAQAEARAKRMENAAGRLGDDETVEPEYVGTEAREAYNAAVEEAAERAVVVRVQSIGRKRMRDLMEAHPPRKVMVKKDDAEGAEPEMVEVDHDDDAGSAVNTETFPMALLTFADVRTRCIVEPEFEDHDELVDFLENDLSEGDFQTLWVAAYMMAREASVDPKAGTYSVGPATSSATYR